MRFCGARIGVHAGRQVQGQDTEGRLAGTSLSKTPHYLGDRPFQGTGPPCAQHRVNDQIAPLQLSPE